MVHTIMKISATADRASGTDTIRKQSQTFDSIKFTQSDWNITYEKPSDTVVAKGWKVTKTVPQEIRGCYLPPAFVFVFDQLWDRKKPATYGFAVYAQFANAFDVFTVTVVGATKIQIEEKEVQAYEVDIQQAEDAPRLQQYVDEKGRFLRSVGGGSVMDAVDRKTLLKAYPKAADLIGKD